MKKLIIKIGLLSLLAVGSTLTSCEDYLSDIPKGQKIPQTWEDFNNFLRNEWNDTYYAEVGEARTLINDIYKTPSQLNTTLTRANYNWDETIDRYPESTNDKYLYINGYAGVFYGNLIIDNAPKLTDCTEAQRQMITAQARVLRCMAYHHVANYHADQYCEATLDKLSIPLVANSGVESPSPQVTIRVLYDFIVADLKAAIESNALPTQGETLFHATKGAAYSLLARVYLSMNDYTNALTYANLALTENNKLFSWIDYYKADKARYDDPENISTNCVAIAKTNPENYIYRGGNHLEWYGVYRFTTGISVERAARFEKGDTRLLTHWKKRLDTSTNADAYYGIYGEELNAGGLTTPEMYYIKAECLARTGKAENIEEAMNLLNTVRKSRILPEFYAPAKASTTKEAVEKIIADKANEYIQTLVPFCDLRRLNKDPQYARTLTKVYNGKTLTLKPDSHLWIMPFSETVFTNPGNGSLQQNTPK